MILYKITNLINGKLYFGITKCSLEKRWREHKSKSISGKSILHNSIRKHGIENFTIEIVDTFANEKEMYAAEIYKIHKFKTTNNKFGYNNSTGGEVSNVGAKHSDETKQKISSANRFKKPNSGSFKKGDKTNLGRALSSETRLKISNTLKGRIGNNWSDEVKKKFSESRKGRKLSQETKDKISLSLKGNIVYHTQATRDKISASNTGKKRTDEVKKRNGILKIGNKNRLGKKHSDETKMIIALKKTGVKQTESHRRNRSEAVKKWWAKRKNKTHGIL